MCPQEKVPSSLMATGILGVVGMAIVMNMWNYTMFEKEVATTFLDEDISLDKKDIMIVY